MVSVKLLLTSVELVKILSALIGIGLKVSGMVIVIVTKTVELGYGAIVLVAVMEQ